MILQLPELEKTSEGVIHQVKITSGPAKLPEKLFYQVSGDFSDFVSDTQDAAVAALLIPAMHYGDDIIVKGKISESLLFNVNNDLQSIYRIFHPHLRKIRIYADNVYNHSPQRENVATGFSGGVDSFHTLLHHYYSDNVSPGYKITHLLYNNVGSHGKAGERLWLMRYKRLKALPEKYSIPFIGVNSNLEEYYSNYNFLQTHTPRDASVGLLLQNGIGKYLYSSSINYPHLNMNPGKPITFADSIVLPRFSTTSLSLLSVGSGSSRVNKVSEIAEIPDSWELLDVCTDETDEANCSKCFKCMKTQFALDVAGKLENYSKVFDLQTYYSKRLEFISSIHRSRLIHLNEILSLAKEKNYKIPMRSYLYAYFRVYGIIRRVEELAVAAEQKTQWAELWVKSLLQKVYRLAS
jgi:hypothetical protein